jgi:hypothetical protein
MGAQPANQWINTVGQLNWKTIFRIVSWWNDLEKSFYGGILPLRSKYSMILLLLLIFVFKEP